MARSQLNFPRPCRIARGASKCQPVEHFRQRFTWTAFPRSMHPCYGRVEPIEATPHESVPRNVGEVDGYDTQNCENQYNSICAPRTLLLPVPPVRVRTLKSLGFRKTLSLGAQRLQSHFDGLKRLSGKPRLTYSEPRQLLAASQMSIEGGPSRAIVDFDHPPALEDSSPILRNLVLRIAGHVMPRGSALAALVETAYSRRLEVFYRRTSERLSVLEAGIACIS